MSTSAWNKEPSQQGHLLATALSYGAATVFAIIVNGIYALFAHGVSSDAMTYMFCYPLVGGAFPALFLWALANNGVRISRSRAAYNLYNAGVATLTVASFLQGVFEIAGTASDYTAMIRVLGVGLLAAAAMAGAIGRFRTVRQ